MIVLDTNVLSEAMRPTPAAAVAAWLARGNASDFYTTAVTEAEILLGIAILPDGRRKQDIAETAHRVMALFSGRILTFDSAAAKAFADIVSGTPKAWPSDQRLRRANCHDHAVTRNGAGHAQRT